METGKVPFLFAFEAAFEANGASFKANSERDFAATAWRIGNFEAAARAAEEAAEHLASTSFRLISSISETHFLVSLFSP